MLYTHNGISSIQNIVSKDLTKGNDLTSEYYDSSYMATVHLEKAIKAKDATKSMKDFVQDLATDKFETVIARYTNFSSGTAFIADYNLNGATTMKNLFDSATPTGHTLTQAYMPLWIQH